MASSSSSSGPVEANETRNWSELPRDVTAMILHKLGAVEILEMAQKVCMTWRDISKDPAMWRSIDMRNPLDLYGMLYSLEKMAMHAVDRSCGQLVDINIEYFGSDEFLQYMTERTSQLRRLRLVYCECISDKGLSEAAKKMPLLEELHIYYGNLTKESLETVGRCCPQLKSLTYNDRGSKESYQVSDDEAFGIAKTMPGLRHLRLFGNKMTNHGLQAILDGCPHLESLDLRQCFKVSLGGGLGKICSERIKDLRRPLDSTEDYEFDATVYDEFDEDSFGDCSRYSDLDLTDEDYDNYFEEYGMDASDVSDYEYFGD